ncbi:MAG: PEP-CTERM sorting domain-containing protein, partial [Planctomycetota bacterium]
PAQWTATGSTNDIAAGNGVNAVLNVLRGVSFFDNNVNQIDLNTGVVTEVVSTAAIGALTGGNVNLTAANETATDGTIFAYESVSDSIISISGTNALAIEVSTADLGSTNVGGLAVAGTDLYIGDNTSDELVVWDVVSNTKTTVFTTAQIDALTDDVDGNVGFGDIIVGPDGRAYFYETDADYLFTFDVLDAAATLSVVLTEQELLDGPGTDRLGQLAILNGEVAWTNPGVGFFTVPEPATGALIALGGLAMLRRRSA